MTDQPSASDDGYMDTSLEDYFKLSFIDPESKESKDMINALQEKVNALARALNTQSVPEVTLPRKGVLKEKLKRQQREVINRLLSPQYALVNAEEQEQLGNIPIQENNEPLVSLESVLKTYSLPQTLSGRPFHRACGTYAGKDRIFWVRINIAHKFAGALKALRFIENNNLRGEVEDCWRPEEVQFGLFLRRLILVAFEHRDWKPEKVIIAAKSITASSPGKAGHQAGAAIDWRLRTRTEKGRKFLEVGNDYPEGGAISSIHFPYITKEQWENRQLFRHLMEMAGFKILTTENWHVSHGDRGMSKGDGMPAQYGPIRSFDSQSGHIAESLASDEIDSEYLTDEEAKVVIEMCQQQWHSQYTTLNPDFFDPIFYENVIQKLFSMRSGKRKDFLKSFLKSVD